MFVVSPFVAHGFGFVLVVACLQLFGGMSGLFFLESLACLGGDPMRPPKKIKTALKQPAHVSNPSHTRLS